MAWRHWASAFLTATLIAGSGAAWAVGPTASNSTCSIVVMSARYGITLPYTDPDGGTMTFTLVSAPTLGSLTYWGSGGYTSVTSGVPVSASYWYYTSISASTGTDSFAWQVSDGTSTSSVVTATILLTTNTPVIANPATNSLVVGTVRYGIYLSNTDPDSYQPKATQLVAPPTRGTLEWNNNSGYVAIASNDWTQFPVFQSPYWYYTPSGTNIGADSFKWRISDGVSTSAVVTMTLAVVANTPPTANNQTLTVAAGTTRTYLNLSYTHPDSYQSLTFNLVTPPTRGILEYYSGAPYSQVPTNAPLSTSGWYYTPSGPTAGTDTFTWWASDGMSTSAPATFTITVNANNPPVLNHLSFALTCLKNSTNDLTSFLSYTHKDTGQSMVFTLTAAPTNGTIKASGTTLNVGGTATANTWTYTPNADFTGPDAFAWTVSDSFVTTAPGTVSITVVPPPPANTPPVFKAGVKLMDGANPLSLGWKVVNGKYDWAGEGSSMARANSVVVAAPELVDWDDDGLMDLLVGQADGRIALFLNQGTKGHPVFNGYQYLKLSNGKEIRTYLGGCVCTGGGPECPVPRVVDWDNDGRKDLIVGQWSGPTYGMNLFVYLNNGTDESPVFDEKLACSLTSSSGYPTAMPCVTDWNGDGITDLISGDNPVGTANRIINVFLGSDNDHSPAAIYSGNCWNYELFHWDEFTPSDSFVTTSPTLTLTNACPLGSRKCVVTADWTGSGSKDLLTGMQDGSVYYAPNLGTKNYPVYTNYFRLQAGGSNIIVGTASKFGQDPAYGGQGNMYNQAGLPAVNEARIAIGDLDGDGLLDLVVGDVNGNVTFFQQYNPKPVAIDQDVIVMPNASKAVTLTARVDSGRAVTFNVITNPAHGYLSGTSSNLVYTPNQDYLGCDQFSFKANDGSNDSNTATVRFTMKSHPPVAQWIPPVPLSSAAIMNMNTSMVLTLTATDEGNEPLTYTIATGPAHGLCTISSNVATYTPTPGYAGPDSFTYQANDGYLASDPATVSLDVCVLAVNFQPKAAPAPAGYRMDSGTNFDAGRGYGWNINLSSQTAVRNRNPVPVLDTVVWSGNATWTCTLSNGNYLVSFACGDSAGTCNGPHQVVVQGVSVLAGVTTATDGFAVTGNVPVSVTNGQLTVAIGDGIHNTGLTYLLVRSAYQAAGGATFVTEDDTTQGSWKGVYGADGYKIVTGLLGPAGEDFQTDYVVYYDPYFELTDTPDYAVVSGPPDGLWGSAQWKAWAFPTNDVRCLEYPTYDDSRIGAYWFATPGNSFVADMNFIDGQTHRVAVYCLAASNSTWAQTFTILDANDATVLDTRTLSNFGNGKWLVWNLSGHVRIRVTCTTGSAAVSGFFFGTYAPPSIVEQPIDDNVQTGQSAMFSLSASGQPLSYKWQRSNDGGATWNDIPGATSDTYTFATTLGDNMARFRCVVSNSYGTATSDATRLFVSDALPLAPVITSPLMVSAVYNQAFSYMITTRNTATYFDAFLPPQVFNIDTSTGLITSSSPAFWIGNNTSWWNGPGTLYIPIFAVNAGGIDAETLTVFVNATNAPLVTSTLSVTGMVGVAFSYTISGNNVPTSYTATGLPPGLTLNAANGVISGSPSPAAAGTTSVRIGAKNANGTGLAQLSVKILSAPAVTAYSPRTPCAVEADTTNLFSVSVTYPAGDTLGYTWKRDGATTATNLASCTYAPGTNAVGLHTMSVVALDSTWGGSVTQAWSVSVQIGNRPPVALNQTVFTPVGTPWPITLTGTDADTNYLTYSVVDGPTNGTLSGTAPNLTYTPASGDPGGDTFTFKANDGFDDSNVGTVTVVVVAAPIVSFALTNTAAQDMIPVGVSAAVAVTGAGQFLTVTNYWHDWPNGAWNAIPMASNQLGVFTNTIPIPGRPSGAIVEYYAAAAYGWSTWTLTTNSATGSYAVQPLTRFNSLSVTGAVTTNLLLGADYQWQRAVPAGNLVNAPFWFDGASNDVTTLWGDANPAFANMPAFGTAEVGATNITLYGTNTGYLAFNFNESNLTYNAIGCDYVNFDAWANAPYGVYTNGGWVVSDGQITNDAAHAFPAIGSGSFAVLNGAPNAGSNSVLSSPFRASGIGQISFWYRNWETTGNPAGRLLVQIAPSDTSTNWTTVATLTNIVSTNYLWASIPLNTTTSHCARILNNPAGTNSRVCLDEVIVADPGANVLASSSLTNSQPTTVFDGVTVSLAVTPISGAVVTNMTCWFATNGVFRPTPMTSTDSVHYVTTAPIFDPSTGTVQYAVQCFYSGYQSESTSPAFFPPGGTNQPQSYTVGPATRGLCRQGFESDTDYWTGLPWGVVPTAYSNNATNATTGWVVNDMTINGGSYGKNSGTYAGILQKADGSNAWIQTPFLANGVGTITVYARNYPAAGCTNRLNVESSYDGATWFTSAVLTNTFLGSSTLFTQLTCSVASTSNQYIRFRKTSTNSDYLVLDDITVCSYYANCPASVTVTNISLSPGAPTTASTVNVFCDILQGNPLFPIYAVSPTLSYRAWGGTYTNVPMARAAGTANTYVAAIPPFNPVPDGIVEYCIRCDFAGYGATLPAFYPAGGTNSPTNYITRACAPSPGPTNTTIRSIRFDTNVWIECASTSQSPVTLWYSTNLLNPDGWMGVTSFCVGALSASNTCIINFAGPTNCPACYFRLGTTNGP